MQAENTTYLGIDISHLFSLIFVFDIKLFDFQAEWIHKLLERDSLVLLIIIFTN